MSGQVSGLVLRMTDPAGGSGSLRTPLRASPEPLHERSGQILADPLPSPHIRAINGTSNAKRARLGAKPGFHPVDGPNRRVASAGGA
jgi:hypothetical protein